MTLCVDVNEMEICFISTCTCPTNRTRREILSPVITENPISGPNIKEPTCNFKIISNKTISDNNGTNFTSQSDDISENLKENATFKFGAKNSNVKYSNEETNLKLHDLGIHIIIMKFSIYKRFHQRRS